MRAIISSREDIVMPSEAAQALGISRERTLRLVQAGAIEGQLIAGRWVISRKSLQNYIAHREGPPQTAA